MVLYGFPTRDERDTFEVAASARPASGRSSRSRSCRCTRRRRCGARCSTTTSTRSRSCPASGKRTAQRLLVELKARLDVPDLDLTEAERAHRRRAAEVREALTGLGYAPDEVRDVVGQLAEDGAVEDLLRDALKLPGGERR